MVVDFGAEHSFGKAAEGVREHYGIETISRSEEPGDDGWAYFLDLWTEDGPARLHVEGEMALTADGRFLVSFSDILP